MPSHVKRFRSSKKQTQINRSGNIDYVRHTRGYSGAVSVVVSAFKAHTRWALSFGRKVQAKCMQVRVNQCQHLRQKQERGIFVSCPAVLMLTMTARTLQKDTELQIINFLVECWGGGVFHVFPQCHETSRKSGNAPTASNVY